MRELVRVWRAEQSKMRHTMLPLLHIGIPLLGSGIFLWYFWVADWDVLMQVSGYLEILGLAFPFLVSIVCSLSVGLEEKNHFQILLGATKGRMTSLLGKCISLQLFGLVAAALAMGTFFAGEMYLLENTKVPAFVYVYAAIGLWLGSIVLYPIHLFLSLQFSRTISMAIGVIQTLLAALLITGLGENRWYFFPGSWSIRLAEYFTTMALNTKKLLSAQLTEAVEHNGTVCLLITAAVYVIIFVWFSRYEGRYCND